MNTKAFLSGSSVGSMDVICCCFSLRKTAWGNDEVQKYLSRFMFSFIISLRAVGGEIKKPLILQAVLLSERL
jgi:hypothetical protein